MKSKNNPKTIKEIGPYQILGEIGRGGMGKVYKAYHSKLEKFVAIKTINNKNITPELKERFLLEARSMANLKHPNIISIHNLSVKENYIVMDFIEGKTLAKILQDKPLPMRFCLELVQKIAETIEYVHQSGMIHRDLKPANIMIEDQSGNVVVMDFGLVRETKKSRKQITQSGDFLGTPRYMAPEQIDGKGVAATADVYALGTILYELASGGVPAVLGKFPLEIVYNTAYVEPKPLSTYKRNISADIQTICDKTLAKEPKDRYQSAKALAEDIKLWLQGQAINAKPLPLWLKATKQIARYKAIITIVTLSLFAFLIYTQFQQYQLSVVVNRYLKRSQQLTSNIEIKPERAKQIILQHLKAKEWLEKAQNLMPESKLVAAELYKIQKKIGLLALIQQDYFLSYIMLKRCKLLAFWKEKIKEQNQKELLLLEKIMKKATPNLSKELMDWYTTKIVQMKNPKILKHLILYLQKTSAWQRRLAIRALGKRNNSSAKIGGKDVGGHLLALLQKTSPITENTEEVIDIIWALGRLKDSRAGILIDKYRQTFGEDSFLWLRTTIPYSWIPLKPETKDFTAQNFFDRGNAKIDKKNYHGAVDDFSKALELAPSFSSAYNSRSGAYRLMGNLKAAIIDATKAIELFPKFKQAYLNRGDAYYQQGKYQKALQDFSSCIKISANFSSGYFYRSTVFVALKQWEFAYRDLKKAILLNSKDPLPHKWIGDVYAYKRMYPKAIASYNVAIKLYPEYFQAYVARGKIFFVQNNLRQALYDCEQAIRYHPKNSWAYMQRGLIYTKQKLFNKALNDFLQTLKYNPKNARAYAHCGKIYERLKKKKKAYEYYTLAITKGMKKMYAYRALLLHFQGDLEAAIADYSEFLTIAPRHFKTWHNRGRARHSKGNIRGAMQDYNRAITINPQYITAYISRASLYKKMGQMPKALSEAKKAYKMAPKNPNVSYSLACYYALSKQKSLALKYLQKSLQYGFQKFSHINKDSDLKFIRREAQFKKLIKKYSKKK